MRGRSSSTAGGPILMLIPVSKQAASRAIPWGGRPQS